MKFPMLMYVCPGPHKLAKGTYDFVAVNNEKEMEHVAKEGFYPTIPEAMEALENPVKMVDKEPGTEAPRRGRPPTVKPDAT